ncbi:MAG: hypothetical protein EP307_02735 [Rhodobacteraceae bacterium]|nr:MAG: hypothetical protein EP307_02735 [Paracoccaceae bacterium]
MMDLAPLARGDRDAFLAMLRPYLAEIAPDLPAPTPDRITQVLDDPARHVLTIRVSGSDKGFVLIRRLSCGTHEMSEFYVLPQARRAGLGTRAARAALTRHPGRWQLGVARAATGAESFWQTVLAPLARAHRGPPLTPHQSGSLHFTIKEPSP